MIKYAVLQLIVAVYLIGTKFMCADIFTKAFATKDRAYWRPLRKEMELLRITKIQSRA